ncbi:MAG: AAA family ATPase, partial [Fibrobacter sp.]|nr:AAA family ATPase [Fibrobacter sp.]
MGIYVNPNNENLKIDMASPIYVDKSMLIAEINRLVKTNKRFVCVSRSRRFGKTMAGNMLSAYFSKGCDSRGLFANLKIAKDPSFEKYLNKLNVIKLDVNSFFSKYGPNADLVPLFTENIRAELRTAFPSVLIPDNEPLAGCLEKIYAATNEQFVVILDEYDVLVRERVSEEV